MEMTVNAIDLRSRVERIRDLPTLPQVLHRVMNLVMDESTSVSQLAREISLDPAITAKLLKVVNSAFYGFYRRIETVHDASVILGLNEIRALVMALSVCELFGKGEDSTFDRTAFWEHSIAVGSAVEIISCNTNLNDPAAFVCGLLHDIGKIVLDQYFRPEWKTVLDYIERENKRDYEAEREILGVDHGEIGYWLSDRWRLPVRIAEVIRHHHSLPFKVNRSANESKEPALEASGVRELLAAVHIGDILVRQGDIGYQGDKAELVMEPLALRILALDDFRLRDCESSFLRRMEALRGALSFIV